MNRTTAPLRFLLAGVLIASLAGCSRQPKEATTTPKPAGKSRLEDSFSPKYGETVLRGFEVVGSVQVPNSDAIQQPNSSLTVVACETKNPGTHEHSRGIVVWLSQYDHTTVTAYLDYDEIQSVLSAITYVSKIDHSSTRLEAFQAEYASRGGLAVTVTGPANGPTISELSCGVMKIGVTVEQLAKFAELISQAKTLLDTKTSP